MGHTGYHRAGAGALGVTERLKCSGKLTGSEAFQPLPFSAATTAWCEVGYVKTYLETQNWTI